MPYSLALVPTTINIPARHPVILNSTPDLQALVAEALAETRAHALKFNEQSQIPNQNPISPSPIYVGARANRASPRVSKSTRASRYKGVCQNGEMW